MNKIDESYAENLVRKWRELAESWIEITKEMDNLGAYRRRAFARADVYRDCADELELSLGKGE